MLEKLEQLKIKFEELGRDLGNPEIISDMKRFKELNREYKKLQNIVDTYNIYKKVLDRLTFLQTFF